PVGVCPTDHHPSPLGEGISDRTEVKGHAAKVVAGPESEVLVVKEQGDAFFLIHARQPTPSRAASRALMPRAHRGRSGCLIRQGSGAGRTGGREVPRRPPI